MTFLAYHAFETAHAIGLTLVRLVVTKRRLLEWETAAATAAQGGRARRPQGVRRFVGRHDGEPDHRRRSSRWSIAARDRDALAVAAPFLLLWAVAPASRTGSACRSARACGRSPTASGRCCDGRPARPGATSKRSSPRPTPGCRPTTIRKRATSRSSPGGRRRPTSAWACCRRSPRTTSATSRPTTLVRRLDLTLTTLEGLERYQGHFLNWYDTATLAPLHPRYVSTVDSGNLAGVADRAGAGARFGSPPSRRRATQLLDGLVDTADLLARASSSSRGVDAGSRGRR